jgi:hypothetical protein
MLAFIKEGRQVSVQCDSDGELTTIAIMAAG